MAKKPLVENLREVSKNLWVSDAGSAAAVGDDFSLVIDCTGYGPTRGNGKTVSIPPTGKTNHTWTEGNLTTIASVASMRLEAGGTVLIHCERGASRSVTAAAATLLWMGRARTVSEAVAKTRFSGKHPANKSLGSLQRWWEVRKEAAQQMLFPKSARLEAEY